MSGTGTDELPGLDLDRLAEYLGETCPGLVAGPLSGSLIAGGKSNLTYTVTDGTGSWVVRRPPLGHVLATAHDMSREVRVVRALAGTEVPVPHVHVLCEDESLLGAPFYVMQHMPGDPYRSAAELRSLGEERTRRISTASIRTMATLHAVDPATVGLSDFGRPGGFLERQVRRWRKQLDASRSRPLCDVDELHDELAASIPDEQPPAIVHGDFRLDNLLVENDRVTAVLDWEMATIGDPLTDVGLSLVYEWVAPFAPDVSDATMAPGFVTGEEMLTTYAEESGRDLSDVGFYVGLAAFKLAAILEGIHRRFSMGQTAGSGFDQIGTVVEPVAAFGRAALRGEHAPG